jgi:hypothetical protein
MNLIAFQNFMFFPPGIRVGPMDGLANRFLGGPPVDRFALLSVVPGGVFVHTRHSIFTVLLKNFPAGQLTPTGVATASRPESAVATHIHINKL